MFDLLVYLVENRDRVVSKDDLIASVWGGRIVSDSTLTSRINAARKAVGDSGKDQKLIRTIARKGLRFVGAVAHAVEWREPEHRSCRIGRMQESASRRARRLPLPDRPAIAVLPFTNMSGDPEQEYFSDGISEDIITALSKLRWFFVIARNSSFIYKGKSVHMKQVADELGVGYVVEGSVRKGGDRVRITAQLNDVATGSHIWAERYDRDLADVFAVQDEITEAIVAAIEPQLYAAENFRAQRKPPDSMDAWDLVMRALSHYWRVTRQDNVVAQALLEKATAIDPNYGQALGVLAASHTFSAHMGWADMATAAPIAERAALAAIHADSEDPVGASRAGQRLSVHAALRRFAGRIRAGVAAQSEFLAGARLSTGWRCPTAAAGKKATWPRAARCGLSPRDPFSAIYYGVAAYAQFIGRNYDEAMRLSRESIRQRSDFVGAPSGADRGRGHGRTARCRQGRVAGASPRAAQYFARLDREPDADPARRRPRALSGRLPPRRAESEMRSAIPSRRRRVLVIAGAAVGLYVLMAYVVLPLAWTHYEHQKGLAGMTMVTHTRQGIPGDPINVGLVGSKADVLCATHAAGWYPADPITLRSSIEIVGSVLLDRPYHDAPVSNLYFQDRREDLAFEKPVGRSADRRSHVRFWMVLEHGQEGRAVWLGSATFDRSVGFNRDNGQVTHHIAPDIDAERDLLTADLAKAKVVDALYEVTGIGPTINGRNGEGDAYYTDGEIKISRLVEGCNARTETVAELGNPLMVSIKNVTWKRIAKVLQSLSTAPDPKGDG